ncbi:MAG: hypothetical protein CVU11_12365 [Bacteroidetes bacterium HGW-Bacteroidetes-6]|jgi:hypothetical protein|nr:MAG: hypothetical protein CVU11_12365 [Bacteroidetes bacterium HGW-Bacteroidetes-6]
MRKILAVLSVVLFAFGGSVLAQSTKYYINSFGKVMETTGDIPAGSFYLDVDGHIRAIGEDGGIYVIKGNKVVAVPMMASSTTGGNNEKKSEVEESDSNMYYIDENKQLKLWVSGSDPGKSYYTNEYGKLLESKGKKKPTNNSTN